MKRVNALVNLCAVITLGAPLIGLLAPEPLGSSRTGIEFDLYIYVSVATTLAFISAAIVFIVGFGGFTPKLKRAYGILCLGLVFYGLAQFQIPLLTVTNLLESAWSRTGLIAIPYLVALISLYWGMRMFARLIQVKSIWTSFWFVLLVATGAAVGSVFVPHFGESSPEVAFDSSVAFSTWGVGFIVASAMLALKIKRTASVTYANAMAWIFTAFMGVGGVGLHYLLSIVLLGDRSEYSESVTLLVTYLFAGLLFMRAAVAFNAIGSQPVSTDDKRTFFGHPQKIIQTNQVSSIDIVVYAAQLVSNQHAIEQSLDQVRVITASLAPGKPLTTAQTTILKTVYLTIERYLTQQEPVRRFTPQSLRSEIQAKLNLNPKSSSTFWPQLFAQPAASPTKTAAKVAA